MSAQREKVLVIDTASDYKPAGWHSRGYLPHFDAAEVFQSITFRLHDSMPQELLAKWREELARESDEIEDALRWPIEAYLDQGYGACHLADDRIVALVQNALLHFDGERYRLSVWVLMPNHVHLLAAPLAGHSLSSMMHSIKSYTAQQANKILQRNGQFWFEDYFDRYIRNAKHFENAVAYIESNPVRAGLCNSPSEWQFGSACFRARQASQA